MQPKNKIIILTPRFPYPVIGGDRLRIYFVCKELSKTYDLTLLSLCETQEELDFIVPEDGVFKRVERVFLPKWNSYLNCIFALPTSLPLQVAYYRSKAFSKKLNELLPLHHGALAHLVRTGDYLLDKNIPKALEMTDAISMNYERVGLLAKSFSIKTLIYSIEQKRLNRYEKLSASTFDISVLVSKFDKDYLFTSDSIFYEKVLVCSNGVNLVDLSFKPCFDSKQIVFIGNMFSVQNIDAAYWFAKNVLPLLREHDDFTFKIIGRIKDSDLHLFEKTPGVKVTGSVDSVALAAENSLLGICSVRLAAGVQNKILEYMALGLPVITSSTGLEGLEAMPNKDILVADEPEQYVDQILRVAKDPEFHSQLASSGLSYVVNHHTWESRLSPFVSEFKKLVG
ncbi:glycosyltransferase family 4 protein [Aeromonas veronii]|uniref:glycosyltransferase family 4 protein n=1 Tax=Aeromonas veronii TaxID=654 RepID=UPI00341E023D